MACTMEAVRKLHIIRCANFLPSTDNWDAILCYDTNEHCSGQTFGNILDDDHLAGIMQIEIYDIKEEG